MFYTLWTLLGCTTEGVFIIYGLGYKLNRVSKGLTWGGKHESVDPSVGVGGGKQV